MFDQNKYFCIALKAQQSRFLGSHPLAKFFEKSDRFIILSFKQMSSFKIIFVVIGILKISTGVLVKMLYLDLLHTCFWRSHVDQNIIDIIKMIECSTMIPSYIEIKKAVSA